MTTKIKIGLSVLAVFVLGGLCILIFAPSADVVNNQNNLSDKIAQTQTATKTNTPAKTQTSTKTSGGYTLVDVASHKSAQSCWSVVSGNVYDLTQWINQHPGGQQAIISMCGVDGTNAFMNQHGGQGRPERELTTFLIGTLTK